MRIVLFVLLMVCSFRTYARDACYALSPDGSNWDMDYGTLCVKALNERAKAYEIKLVEHPNAGAKSLVQFNFTLLERRRCLDCDGDKFGVAIPSRSLINALTIHFDGQINMRTWKESGKVTIGQTELYYHSH